MDIDERFILDNVNAFVYITDKDGRYLYANQRLCEFFGVTPQTIIGRTDGDFFDASTAQVLRENDRRVLEGGVPLSAEERATIDGEERSYWSVKIPLRNATGQIYALLGITTDITELARAREKLRVAAEVFAQAQEGIFVTNDEGKIIEVNDAFCRTTGYTHDEIMKQSLDCILGDAVDGDSFQFEWRVLKSRDHVRGETYLRKKDGSVFPATLSLASICDTQGGLKRMVGVFSDITLLKRQQQILEKMAFYDPLTHLPNRVLLADRLKTAMARALRDRRLLAVCYLDLDGFKQVNDTYGHEIGDILLVEVSQRFFQILRANDTVSRLGGDEFVVLLEGFQAEVDCREVIARIQQVIAKPYFLQGQEIVIGVSIGVALFPGQGKNADELLRHADQAMYRAKMAGRNRCEFFPLGGVDAQGDNEKNEDR